MYWTLINIDWKGTALTDEQRIVVRNAAARHLSEKRKSAKVHFKHEICEGVLTLKNEGVFGGIPGTFFHADLGTVNGQPWSYDFLIPRGTEDMLATDDNSFMSMNVDKDGAVKKITERKLKKQRLDAVTLHSLQ